MSRTDVYNHFGNNRSADEIARALGLLASQSRAEKRRLKGDGGRHVDRWYTVTHNVNNVNNGNSVNSHHADGDDGLPATLFPLNTLNTYSAADSTGANNGHKAPGRPCLKCGAPLTPHPLGSGYLPCANCAVAAAVDEQEGR